MDHDCYNPPEFDVRLPVPINKGPRLPAESPTTADEVRDIFREAAAAPPLKGIMGVLEGEWASSRMLGDQRSSVVDLPLVQVLDDKLVSIAAWYDNEIGYATRLAETAARLVN